MRIAILAILGFIVLPIAGVVAGACSAATRTRGVSEFYVIFIPSSFGGSATDLRVYADGTWVSAVNVTQNGYNVTAFFRTGNITITRVGIYHNSGGYSDPTRVIIKLANGTVILNTTVSSHTWQSGTSYFEYVDIPATNVPATGTENYTEYTCEFDTPVTLQGSQYKAVKAALEPGIGYSSSYASTGRGQTVTQTLTRTYTTTVTKTVTGPGGKTTVVTTVETVTVPPGQGPASHRRALLLGLGALAFLLLLLARR